jgi:hypothetical protein
MFKTHIINYEKVTGKEEEAFKKYIREFYDDNDLGEVPMTFEQYLISLIEDSYPDSKYDI